MRSQLSVLLAAALLAGCGSGSGPSLASSASPEATVSVASASPAVAASPATLDPARCSMASGCGKAHMDPEVAAVGSPVRIEADTGYFGSWTPEGWATWCGDLSIAFHALDGGPVGSELPGPNGLYPGVRAGLTITGPSTATFVVPGLPAGTYRPALSCSGDEAFAWPELPDTFRVIP